MNKAYKFALWLLSWPFDTGVACMMLALGIILIIWPERGLAGYIHDTFSISMSYYGVLTILCALELLYKPGVLRFSIFSTPVMLYAAMSVPYFFHGMIEGNTSAGTTIVVAWGGLYWLMSWVNVRRGKLLQKITATSG